MCSGGVVVPCDKNNSADGNFTVGYLPEGAFMLESPKTGKDRNEAEGCGESTKFAPG
jgi:hypothetical protein